MNRPDLKAPTHEWQQWADTNYPFDGRSPKGRTGFDLVRSEADPRMRGEMAWAIARGLPPDVSPPAGYRRPEPEPDRRCPPEPDLDDDNTFSDIL